MLTRRILATTAAMLTLVPLASCSGAPTSSAISSSAISSTATARATPAPASATTASRLVLLDASDIARLKAAKASTPAAGGACTGPLTYRPHPLGDLNPAPHYTSEGPNPPSTSHQLLQADSQQAYHDALCYLRTGSVPRAQQAQRIIDAWATTLKKASTVSGRAEIAFDMVPMTAAASWVRGVGGWNGARYATLLRTVSLPATDEVMAHKQNHGLWGVLFQSSAAVYLQDRALLSRTRDRWQALMAQEVDSSGVMTHEIQRSATSDYTGGPDKGKKGMAYTHYAMLPASLSAKIFADQGVPVWQTPGGVLLGKAFAQAARWTLHPETFPYYASNKGQLDGVRAASYFSLLLQHYPSVAARKVLAQGGITADTFDLLEIFPVS